MKSNSSLYFKLPDQLRDDFRRHAESHGIQSVSALLRLMLREEIRNKRAAHLMRVPIVKSLYGEAAELTADDGKVYHCQVIPYRHRAVLVMLDPASEGGGFDHAEARGSSELIDEVLGVVQSAYDWDTPAYREICAKLNLDPDKGRPQFQKDDEALARSLDQFIDWETSNYELIHTVFDLIELMRLDTPVEYRKYEDIAETLSNWTFEVDIALFKEAFARVDSGVITSRDSILNAIEFLPSWEGVGYFASIYLWSTDDCEQDGWSHELYRDVRGVALMPIRMDRAMEVVVTRLSEQGVTFLDRKQARHYMDTEGAYWAYKHKHHRCPHGLEPRKPTLKERILWKATFPQMPIFDQFRRQTAS